MDPSISDIVAPQAWDISEGRQRYGDPAAADQPGDDGGDMDLVELVRILAECWRTLDRGERRMIAELVGGRTHGEFNGGDGPAGTS